MVLKQMYEKYFENGVRELLHSDYETIGAILGKLFTINLHKFAFYLNICQTHFVAFYKFIYVQLSRAKCKRERPVFKKKINGVKTYRFKLSPIYKYESF